MAEKVAKPGWTVYDHEIHGVTPDMIDWWWVNMDKGYPLWHPEDHKSYVLEVPPKPGTVLGGIAKVEQVHHGAPRKPRGSAGYVDPDLLPQDIKDWITYDHLMAHGHLGHDNKLDIDITHEYEAASYGTRHRFTIYQPIPAEARTEPTHFAVEAKRWEEFLPELYKMWKVVKDPAINRQCCCKIKREGSTIKYVR